MNVRRLFRRVLISLAVLAVAVQLVPYGRNHSNPPTTREPAWNAPITRTLAMRACGDCHSNQTTWPWYSNVAPMSWLVQNHVDGGRGHFNFSVWDKPQDVSIGDIIDSINGGGMPPWDYLLLHPSASLSKQQKAQLIQGLRATLATSPPIGGGG